MDISFDAVLQSDMANSATDQVQQFPFTVGAGSHRLLTLFTFYSPSLNAGSSAIQGVTFNGVPLTAGYFDPIVDGANLNIETWYLVNPDVGTFDIEVTFDNTHNTIVGELNAISHFGVNQSSPFERSFAAMDAYVTSDNLVTTLDGFAVTTLHDKSWLLSYYYNNVFATTFIQNTGVLRAQKQFGASGYRHALVDYGPLSPAGSFKTALDTSVNENLRSRTLVLRAAGTKIRARPIYL